MITLRSYILFLLPPSCLLAGCAGNVGGYPSLAPRPVERAMQMPAGPVAAPVAPVPAFPGEIAAIVAAAREADATFQARLAEQRPAIEAGRKAAAGSESWVVAQEAYSAVDSARGGTGSALADLDRLHQEAVAAGDSGRQAIVESAIGQVQAIDQAERAILAKLLPPA